MSVDYPDLARLMAAGVAYHNVEKGILICTTGVSMSITANKVPGMRASLCHDPLSIRLARLHNDANILCLGAGIVGLSLAQEIVRVWLEKIRRFEGELPAA
jgi:ribose 5-phosphate isomerase B